MSNLIWITIFGVFGVLSRYGIDLYFMNWNERFPASTLAVNFFGSFLAGSIYAMSTLRPMPSALQTGLLIGFCGGFTTFSAYTLQTFTLLERGKVSLAIMYFVISPVVGLLAAFIPILLTRKFVG